MNKRVRFVDEILNRPYKLRRLSKQPLAFLEAKNDGVCYFSKLPKEIVSVILSFLSFKELSKLCTVCSEWNFIIKQIRIRIDAPLEKKISNDIMDKVVASCPNLKALYLPALATNRELELVGSLNNLTQLILMIGSNVTTRGLQNIGKLSKLTRLKIYNWRNTSGMNTRALHFLPQLKNLTELWIIWGVKLGDSAIKIISEVPSLQHLKMSCFYRATDAGVSALTKLKNLKTLHLIEFVQITEKCLDYVTQFPKLQDLAIVDSFPTTDSTIEKICGSLKTLTELELEHCGAVTQMGLNHLSALTKLRRIRLEGLPQNVLGRPVLNIPASEIQIAQAYSPIANYNLSSWVFLVPKMDVSDRKLLERHARTTQRILLR